MTPSMVEFFGLVQQFGKELEVQDYYITLFEVQQAEELVEAQLVQLILETELNLQCSYQQTTDIWARLRLI